VRSARSRLLGGAPAPYRADHRARDCGNAAELERWFNRGLDAASLDDLSGSQ
jgi:hypothetical protein